MVTVYRNQREKTLATATQLVNGDRETDYGTPTESLSRIAALWTPVLGRDIAAHEVALCMALLKIARLTHTPGHADSWADLAGYAAIGSETASKETTC